MLRSWSEIAASKIIVLGCLVGVAFGRWGSYLGVPGTPLYAADLLIMSGFALLVLSYLAGTSTMRIRTPPLLTLSALLMLMVLAVGILGAPEFSIYTFRDAAPFVYLSLLPGFYHAVRILGRGSTFRWIRNAAIVHLIWYLPAAMGVLPEIAVPFAGVPAFSTRGDFDLLVSGIALAALHIDERLHFTVRVPLMGLAMLSILLGGSRAGLFAALAVYLVTLLTRKSGLGTRRRMHRLGLLLVASAPAMVAGVFLLSNPPRWAAGFIRLVPNQSAQYQSGQNTWQARLDAWALVIHYVLDSWKTLWFGYGFGSNPVAASGALRYLSGDPTVRAAHNVAVTWVALTGVVGLSLVIGALILIFAQVVKLRREPAEKLKPLGLGLAFGILVSASAGVILESPFGYLAFVLALACLTAPDGRQTQGKRKSSDSMSKF